MDKRILKTLKVMFFICFCVLLVEVLYSTYVSFFREKKSIYFDGINAVEINKNNDYVTVGSNNNNDMHYEKAKITKYNAKKERIFETLYNKGFNGAFFDVTIDDGDYIAVGSYEATEEEHEKGIREALFVKYDNNGKVIFDKSFKALDDSKFVGVEVIDDGYLVVGQSIYNNMTLGLSEKGGAYLVKLDKVGNIVWKSNYGGNKAAIYNDVVVYDNYIYVTGRDSSRIGLLNKYDMDGNLVKSAGYEYTDSLGFTSMVVLDDGIVVSGAKKSVDEKNNSIVDALLVKYDFDCNYINGVSYDDLGIERFNRVIKGKNNNLLVVGNKVSSDTSDTSILYNGIIGKYKSDLTSIKIDNYGEQADDHFTDVLLLGDNYLVVGYGSYEDGSYLGKFIVHSDALKILEVR